MSGDSPQDGQSNGHIGGSVTLGAAMIVTKLEQWKSEREPPPEPFTKIKRTHVAEIECTHCHRRFLRWSSMVAAYGLCGFCSVDYRS